MRKDIKTSCQKRLSRIEGQVRGLSKMVDEDRYCIDIVTQISAVRAALRRVEEARFDQSGIRTLYESEAFPLPRRPRAPAATEASADAA